jgi:hypothetical protein
MRRHRSFLALFFSRDEVPSLSMMLVVLLVFPPPGLWNMPALYRDAGRIEQEGASADANVMALEKFSGEAPSYHVSYAFTVNGDWVEATSEVSEAFFEGLQVEDRLPVRYWVRDPTVAEIEPGWSAFQIRHGLIFRGLLLLLFLPFFLPAAMHAARVRWLVRYGLLEEAVVTDIEMTSRDDGGEAWHARWTAPDFRTGLTSQLPLSDIPAVGSRIAILTDPNGRRGSVWEGDT